MIQRMNSLFRFGLLLTIFSGMVVVVTAQSSASLYDLVEPGAPERIATGFIFTEGPIWHPDGYLLFSDVVRNRIYRWTPDGRVVTFRSPSGNSNGLTFDSKRRLISCEHGNRQVSCTEADSSIVVLASRYDGKKLNSPNDVVVRSDGNIYFTDPPYGVSGTERELSFQGVYRVLPDSNRLELLVDDIFTPNGLSFSPDEKVLYVANTEGDNIYAFDVLPTGGLANRRVFADIMYGKPDGIKVDIKGNLYIATNTFAVGIYDSTGRHIGDIRIPETTTNCAFGGPDNKTLSITAGRSVYRVQLKVQGVPVISDSPVEPGS